MAIEITFDEVATILRLDKQGCSFETTKQIMNKLRELADAQQRVTSLQIVLEDMIAEHDIENDVLTYPKMYTKDN